MSPALLDPLAADEVVDVAREGDPEAGRLDALLAIPDEPENASPGAGGYWSEAFQRLVTTLHLRATILTELTPPPS